MAWNLVSVSWSNYYMPAEGWQNIVSLIGGTVSTAEDLGITSLSGLSSQVSTPSVSEVGVYVPDNANYGVILFGGGGSGTYYRNCALYVVPLETGDVTALGSIPTGITLLNTTVRVWVGDGFSVITSMQDASYTTGGFCFDNFTDEAHDRTVIGVVGSASASSYSGFDLYNGTSLTGAPIGTTVAQTDGTLYIELIKLYLISTSEVLVAENLYRRYYDYNTSEKNVVLNGAVFSTVLTTEIFFISE